jgi:aminomethyltransferase
LIYGGFDAQNSDPVTKNGLQTPLYQEHLNLRGKIVDFAGWLLPVEFAGLRLEHMCVREKVGLFDVSHMGEIRVRGSHALKTLQWLTTNDVAKLASGQSQYTLLGNEQGGIVDDLIVYCVEPGFDYLLCVNASNTDKDHQWMVKHNQGAEIINESSNWAQLAVQGPQAMELLSRVLGPQAGEVKAFHFAPIRYRNSEMLMARTGYTGEAGMELFVRPDQAVSLWRELLEKGKDLGVQPIGLAARDTLRIEMKYSLYGHEIDDSTNPYAAGLGWVVKPQAKTFLGQKPMLTAKESGLSEKLVGFKLLDRGIPRQGYNLFCFDNKEIGRVTSGTLSPVLNEGLGIGYVALPHSQIGCEFFVQIRERKLRAQVVATPFVKSKGV